LFKEDFYLTKDRGKKITRNKRGLIIKIKLPHQEGGGEQRGSFYQGEALVRGVAY